MYPGSKHCHPIDYIIMRQRDLKDVLHIGVMPSAEYNTDNRLVCCKLSFQFKLRSRRIGAQRETFKVRSLHSAKVKTTVQESLQSKPEELSFPADSTTDVLWDQTRTVIMQTSVEVLRHSTKTNPDWFDENNDKIQYLLEEKR